MIKRVAIVFSFFIGLIPVETLAQTSSTITVNYSIDKRASNQVASGLLHGISARIRLNTWLTV